MKDAQEDAPLLILTASTKGRHSYLHDKHRNTYKYKTRCSYFIRLPLRSEGTSLRYYVKRLQNRIESKIAAFKNQFFGYPFRDPMSRPLSHRGLPLLLLVFFLHQELTDAACTGPEYITACLQLAKAKTLESRCSEACKYGWGSQLQKPRETRTALPPSARNARTAQTFLRLGLHPAAPSRCASSAFVDPMPSFHSTHSPAFTCTLFQFRPTLSRAPRPNLRSLPAPSPLPPHIRCTQVSCSALTTATKRRSSRPFTNRSWPPKRPWTWYEIIRVPQTRPEIAPLARAHSLS